MAQPLITTADASRILESTPFACWWQLELVELGAGWASVRLPGRPGLLRPGDVLHGSCYEVVADVAMWLAIMTLTDPRSGHRGVPAALPRHAISDRSRRELVGVTMSSRGGQPIAG